MEINAGTDKWDAGDYAKNSAAQESWAHEMLAKLDLEGSEHLLDIGCGDGKITYAIAQKLHKGRVVGIDRSPGMIRLAKELYDLPHLSFSIMDAAELSVLGKFDVAFSNAALHWVNDHQAVLAALKNQLRRHGKLLFQMGGYGNAQEVLEVVEQLTASEKWKNSFADFQFPYRFCKVEDYEKWLPQAGYEPRRIELLVKDMVHDNGEEMKGWLRTTWFPFTDCLAGQEKEEFLNLVVQKYCESHPVDSAGRIHVRMVRLEVEARNL